MDYPYTYRFLKERIETNYANDQKTGTVFSYFSLLAIFISCLGLFGLTSYTTEQRKKEIGIRKVLGSSIFGVMLVLSKEFLKSVILALVIAWPFAWLIMKNWLNGFAYRIELGVTPLLIASFMTTLTAMVSICLQTIKAAKANPVQSLKYE